jgi:uncharacterized protein (UPF0335 family)
MEDAANDDGGTVRAGHNGFDPDKAQSFIDRCENIDKELEREKGEYMARCKALRGDKKDVLSEAKDQGFNTTAMKAVLKTRALERKVEETRDELDNDVQDSFDNIRLAIGDLADLPLGQAALAQAAE